MSREGRGNLFPFAFYLWAYFSEVNECAGEHLCKYLFVQYLFVQMLKCIGAQPFRYSDVQVNCCASVQKSITEYQKTSAAM